MKLVVGSWGGSGRNQGRKRRHVDGAPETADNPVTDEEVAERSQRLAYARTRLYTDDIRDVDKNWRAWVKPPLAVPSPFAKADEELMYGVLRTIFRDKKAKKKLSFVRDRGEDTSGQVRFFVKPTKLQGRKERVALGGLGTVAGDLTVAPGSWDATVASRRTLDLITQGGLILLHVVQDMCKVSGYWMHEPGYPRHVHETEVIMTPGGSKVQFPHQDARFNLLVVFNYISDWLQVGQPKTFTTWVGTKKTVHAQSAPVPPLEYEQMPRPELPELARWALANHAAWPHYGPGNTADGRRNNSERIIVMYVFALDEKAERHLTSENVYKAEDLRKTSVVYPE